MTTSAWDVAAEVFESYRPVNLTKIKLLDHQLPPPEILSGEAHVWLMEAGRGSGKTYALAKYFSDYMRNHPRARGRIIAPTWGDAIISCIEPPAGLLAVDPVVQYTRQRLVWPNGSEAVIIGLHSPLDVDRLRASGNRHIDWWEELAANRQLGKAWDQAQFGLRLGRHPHTVASTTPRGTRAYKAVRESLGVVRTHATIDDNPYLVESWKASIMERYAGTGIGQQELYGRLIDEIEGALWARRWIEDFRVDTAPELVRKVVGVDPSSTSGELADETGIIVAGIGHDKEWYVLDDASGVMSPDTWARKVVDVFYEYECDHVIMEAQPLGEAGPLLVAQVDDTVPVRSKPASRSKKVRAEPVSALYQQGRVHHVGLFPELEDQQCTWVQGEKSPDRLDALVWAISDLRSPGAKMHSPREARDQVQPTSLSTRRIR